MSNFKLAFGPMSIEAINAVFAYSQEHCTPLALIASKNQIDYSGGYVEDWTTAQFMAHIQEVRLRYPAAVVDICRDHCGPGFNGRYDLADTYHTLDADLAAGFDFIHFDFSKMIAPKTDRITETVKAITYCLERCSPTKVEVGTDENSLDLKPFDDIVAEVVTFDQLFKIDYYVVKTGSLIMETRQIGEFHKPYVDKVKQFLNCYNIKLKEHNADYLTPEEIQLRSSVDCMNIAPQLGVVQTDTVLALCQEYKVDYVPWMKVVWKGQRWEKWMIDKVNPNSFQSARTAGHYHFTSLEYKKIIFQLKDKGINPELIIEDRLAEVIHNYASNRS